MNATLLTALDLRSDERNRVENLRRKIKNADDRVVC